MAAASALVLPSIAGYDFETGADLGNPSQRTELSSAAIRAFINLSRKWKLTEEQARALLGGLASSTFHAWKANPNRTLENRGSLFAGRTPAAFMIQRGQPGMVEVRRMLDSWRGGR